MEITEEQRSNAQVVEKAWEDAQFKNELITNPVEAIEKLTGNKVVLPNGHKLVVVDQSDESTIYFNIPKKLDVDNLQLTEEQLETVAGGTSEPFTLAIIVCIGVGATIYGATHH